MTKVFHIRPNSRFIEISATSEDRNPKEQIKAPIFSEVALVVETI